MTKEVLELALEALEGFIPYLPLKDEAQCNRYDKAITAIKEALAQKDVVEHDLATAYRTELDKLSQRNYELRMENAQLKAQPKEQEPVAWLDEYGNAFPLAAKQYSIVGKHWKPLYITPPQRKPLTEWQPIETAPRDGTEILMTNGVDVSSGQWFSEYGGTYDQEGAPNGDGCDAGWMDWSGGIPDPTHWMPLPPPSIEAAHGIKE